MSSKAQKKAATAAAAAQPKQAKKDDAKDTPKKTDAQPSPGAASSNPAADKRFRAQADALLSLLECPVCRGDLTSPIYQCISGHVLCAACLPRVDRCPSCSEPLGKKPARNLHLEKLAQTVEVVCKFPSCGQMLPLSDRASHEGTCVHRPWSCPENWKECNGWLGTWEEEPACTWAGDSSELVPHYKAKHSKQKRFDDWKSSTFGYTFELCADEHVAATDICQSQPVLIHSSRFVWISLSQSATHLSVFAVKVAEPRIPGETYTMRVSKGDVSITATLPLYSVRDLMENIACPDWEVTRRTALRMAENNTIRFEFAFTDPRPAADSSASAPYP